MKSSRTPIQDVDPLGGRAVESDVAVDEVQWAPDHKHVVAYWDYTVEND
jgi:hypothetical protein